MNRYHESMEHCAPPPELEEQLREAVLSAEPEPQARTAVYRPPGIFPKGAAGCGAGCCTDAVRGGGGAGGLG